jgi:UDP-N-acetyl-D-galactosamine dehydrogenase
MRGALNRGFVLNTDINDARDCNVFIVTVPTPTDKNNRPVLTPMIKASQAIAELLKLKSSLNHLPSVIIYESTVYPGVTEDEMVPVLERVSGLKYNEDFFVGYSPERINPGDKEHTVTKILKVTSGSTPEIAEFIDQLYKSIIIAGTHKAPSIKVAEAAKVIENSQRDINIAFVNELSKIFNLMGIDTLEVLEAAGTKWNFLKFKPGLVGGHCIGVDPYYLTHRAQQAGYHSKVITSGRYVNDSMGFYIAKQAVKRVIAQGKIIQEARALIMGTTFKEDVSDIRNSKVIDIVNELKSFQMSVDLVDPHASSEEMMHEYGVGLIEQPGTQYDAIIVAVNHREYADLNESYFKGLLKDGQGVFIDVKGIYKGKINSLVYWSL